MLLPEKVSEARQDCAAERILGDLEKKRYF